MKHNVWASLSSTTLVCTSFGASQKYGVCVVVWYENIFSSRKPPTWISQNLGLFQQKLLPKLIWDKNYQKGKNISLPKEKEKIIIIIYNWYIFSYFYLNTYRPAFPLPDPLPPPPFPVFPLPFPPFCLGGSRIPVGNILFE